MLKNGRLLSERGVHTIGVFFVLCCVFMTPFFSFAASSSSSYRIISDSLDCGGSDTGSSTSFNLGSSVCEEGPGVSTSSNFGIAAGYQNENDIPFITLSLSANSIALGTLTTGSVYSQSITTTVVTNAVGGYTSQIYTDGGFRNEAGLIIDPVTDGTVTAGQSEYGIRTSGTDGQLNGTDTGISTTPLTYASNSAPANSTTTVTFKTAISPLNGDGHYRQAIYIRATGTF